MARLPRQLGAFIELRAPLVDATLSAEIAAPYGDTFAPFTAQVGTAGSAEHLAFLQALK